MEDSELEKYKLATLEVLKSLGGIASDTRFLHYSVFLSLEDIPPDDPEYDYASVTRGLRLAREALLKEGKVTFSDGRIWRLARPEPAPATEPSQPGLDEEEFWDLLTTEEFFSGYSEEDVVHDTI